MNNTAARLLAISLTATALATEPFSVVVELETPGGALPFEATIRMFAPDLDPALLPGGYPYVMTIQNGIERIDVDGGSSISPPGFGFNFDSYGNNLGFIWDEPEYEFHGQGTFNVFRRKDGWVEIPLTVRPSTGPNDRFQPIENTFTDITGRYRVNFAGEDDDGIATFEIDDSGIATGTFRTTTGDYRYLDGRMDGNLLRLSAFDGAHAFLFHATVHDDGSLTGDFWSGTWFHDTWTAVPDDNYQLPDPWSQTIATTPVLTKRILSSYTFTSPEGEPVTLAEIAPHGKPRVIELFGTWCPNCTDAANTLKDLAADYPGLHIAGLAFEHTRDQSQAAERVAAYAQARDIPWPLAVAGFSDKAEASKALPIVDKVRSYPTTIFVNPDGTIRAVHSGFDGPATGEPHDRLVRTFRQTIEAMLEDN